MVVGIEGVFNPACLTDPAALVVAASISVLDQNHVFFFFLIILHLGLFFNQQL